MSQPVKRSAEEAFEGDQLSEQKRQKKHKSRRKERRDLDARQLHTEPNDQERAVEAGTTSVVESEPPPEPVPTSSEIPLQNDATQPIRKKKRRERGKQPDSQREIAAEHTEEDGQAEAAQNAYEPQGSTSVKQKKKKHRQGKGGADIDSGPRALANEVDDTHELRDHDTGAAQVLPPQREKHGKRKKKRKNKAKSEPNATMQDVPQPDNETELAAKQQKRSKKKEKKRSRAGRGPREEGGVGLTHLKKAQDTTSTVPLGDRIQPPSKDVLTNEQESQSESEDEYSESDAEHGAQVDGLVPLEDRIEVPAGARSKPKKYQEGWSVSDGVGGIFSNHDPILTADNEHLILPTRSDVRVYSQSTSLLVRRLESHLRKDDHVVNCAFCASDPALLLVATWAGHISLWDWTQGEKIDTWKTSRTLGQILPLPPTMKVQRVLAVYGGHQQNETTISILDLDPASIQPTHTVELLKRKGLNVNIRLFERTGVIVATTRRHVLIGYCPGFGTDDKSPTSFYWRELIVPSTLMSFDARSVDERRAGNTPRVDIAVGVESGEIMLYEDLLFKLIGKEKQKTTVDISARILHWHRGPVSSVKWSRDGNYLTSGGRETVLVIWNLDTNQQQYLPHLSSEIMNISVSPKGSSYALRLSDNSVMVLSTANLDAMTNISGFAGKQSSENALTAALHPTSPDRLLVAVSKSIFRKDQSATALQTYDLNTDRELGRQALTRNSTTVVTTQSSASANLEPNVTHICLSADGKWLATLEEWHADPQDLDGVTLTSEDNVDDFGAESCLKIWLYNEQQSEWELVNRIDNPHSRGSIKVLALESSPCRNEFATAGADGKVKIWRPRARVRDGVAVRNESGEQLYNWSQMFIISCAFSPAVGDSAALAYSPDGTVIGASWSQPSALPRWTYFLDSDLGRICHSTPDLLSHGPASMVFSDRYLVSLSDTVCIYDTVSGTTISKTRLGSQFLGKDRRGYLASNILDGTVAVAVNPTNGKEAGRLAIIDVKNLEKSPLFEKKIPAQIHALLTSPSMQGYVIIDGKSKISRVRRTGSTAAQSMNTAGEVREPEDVRKGLDRIFGRVKPPPQLDSSRDAGGKLLTVGEEHASSRTLEDVLNFQTSAAAPGVGELFDRIAGLFARPSVAT